MNSIRYFFVSLFYNFLFNLKLNKVTRFYSDEIVKDFDLVDPKGSYWIECNKEYANPPQIVDENKEFSAPLRKQTEMIMKSWQYFPASVHKDLFGLIKYIVWLRKTYLNKKQYNNIYQNKVSDHIYEM